LRDIMVRNGDANKAIWISEMNWNVAPEDVEPRYGRATLDQQARWAPLAYERAQEDWPWIGVVAFWYFKRADDTWLVEKRPEAYFQMAEPDFTLMPVYESMKAHTTDPPALHRGTHRASYWAISYGKGWKAESDLRVGDEDSDPVTFLFEGTEIQIVFGPQQTAPNSAIRYFVDDRRTVQVQDHVGGTTWQGGPGLHTITITPTGDVALQYLIVRRGFPVLPVLIGLAVLVIGGAILAASRSLEDR
jgi:hypothetical protein